jgi:HAD superfamily hydrolase (TIGR01549 family)
MIQGIIFDFDGTLYDYELCNRLSLNSVFNLIEKRFMIKKDIIEYKYNKINKSIKESNNYSNKFNKYIYFKKLLEELNIHIEQLDIIINTYNTEFNSNIKLYDNIIDFIQFIKNNNIKIGILSNNNFKQQYDKLVNLGLIEYIDFIQTSDENGVEKPNNIMYLSLLNRMKLASENTLMIGDNIHHDIIPCIELGLIPFHFKNNEDDVIYFNNYFEFGNYKNLLNFYKDYVTSQSELIYLSKLFGSSILNIQGQGGNISVKTLDNRLIIIKSSGGILGNIDNLTGFCLADNAYCNNLLKDGNSKDLNKIKIFGKNIPSMETFFHCFMKKYTVHIHFTLSNIFLVTNVANVLDKMEIPHKVIDYYPPGIVLANEIKKIYNKDTNLYFLKNHGLIITSDKIEDIGVLYTRVFEYFDSLLYNKYSNDLITFNIIDTIYNKFGVSMVCRKYNFDDIFKIINIKYCFPDLAVYIQKMMIIYEIAEIKNFTNIPDIIICNDMIFVLANNIMKLYCMLETLDKYKILCENYDNLEIIDNNFINNMEQEKYRKHS